jgi:hypothetical protein
VFLAFAARMQQHVWGGGFHSTWSLDLCID